MKRIKTGWALTKKSWSVLRADRSLVVFPVLAVVFSLLAWLIIWIPSALAAPDLFDGAGSSDTNPVLIAVVVLSAFVTTTIAVFFNVALAAAAQRALRGENTTVSQGLSVARSRMGAILGWAVLATTVGLVLRAIEQRFQGAGALAAWIIGAAWGIASFFAIPVVALEGEGPFRTLKRSTQIVRQKWGEGFTGAVAIGAVTFVAVLAALLVGGGLAVAAGAAGVTAAAIALAALTALAVVLIGVISSALNQVFRVAVYDYALSGEVEGAFSAEELDSAFRPSRRSR